ncbi:MAG: hypothetical protein ABIU20_00175 [Blastocatellia bacterium]
MSEQVTIQVSEQVIYQVAQIAAYTQKSKEAVLSGLIESSLSELPAELLSDEQVLALSEMQMGEEQDAELSDLLARQREGQLDAKGRRQLSELMQVYERGLLRKSQALRVAVERGLREPLRF